MGWPPLLVAVVLPAPGNPGSPPAAQQGQGVAPVRCGRLGARREGAGRRPVMGGGHSRRGGQPRSRQGQVPAAVLRLRGKKHAGQFRSVSFYLKKSFGVWCEQAHLPWLPRGHRLQRAARGKHQGAKGSRGAGLCPPAPVGGAHSGWAGRQAGTVMYRQVGGVLWTHGQRGGGHHGCPQGHTSQTDGRGQEGSVQGSWGGWGLADGLQDLGLGCKTSKSYPLGLRPASCGPDQGA